MPFYEYRCTNENCIHHKEPEEHLESFWASTERACEKCGQLSKRIISRTQFMFAKKPGEANPIQGTAVDTGTKPDFDYHFKKTMRPTE